MSARTFQVDDLVRFASGRFGLVTHVTESDDVTELHVNRAGVVYFMDPREVELVTDPVIYNRVVHLGLPAEPEETVPSFTCPRCGMTSFNPHDVEESYCGSCHEWAPTTDQPCEHTDAHHGVAGSQLNGCDECGATWWADWLVESFRPPADSTWSTRIMPALVDGLVLDADYEHAELGILHVPAMVYRAPRLPAVRANSQAGLASFVGAR